MSRRNNAAVPKPSIADQDRRYMEQAISALPRTPVTSGEATFGDRLLNYGYHQNPYVRTFSSVLWSGYALSRGQVIESDARFRKAREDATVSNVDKTTIAALDSAHNALQQSLAPDGSIAVFLDELRNVTIQRMWSRVCETSMLPPPSFRELLRDEDEERRPSGEDDELDPEELAEIRAMMRNPPDVQNNDADDGDAPIEDIDAATVAALTGAAPAKSEDDNEADGQSGGDSEAAPTAMNLEVARTGAANMAAELVLAAASDICKELRTNNATGDLKITITVSGTSSGRGRRRRRRGRRR